LNISKYQKYFGVGPLGALISAVMFGFLWLLDRSFHHVRILRYPKPFVIIGSALIGLWICWHAWSLITISQWWHHDRLCTTGPYRFVRHPIYAGGALLGATGISLIFNSWIILPLPVLAFAVYSILIRKEESMMLAVFGEEYQRYAARTGRLSPRLRSCFRP
jgi:protein-S-isoprenylcysteine O-methyltransferase Ste14